ncbi:hypothetical protein GUJ93_ZPchr0001g32917 [Zizania palustris]|uniref:Uncharacterized protein n=1 Tax=Zizania palustris TaxID=103762 RepID=A0A8J5V1D2_ZIZPA|nr:hypothetical protein GUJ93_ZPchr0001g32917 [Zizania palustris]
MEDAVDLLLEDVVAGSDEPTKRRAHGRCGLGIRAMGQRQRQRSGATAIGIQGVPCSRRRAQEAGGGFTADGERALGAVEGGGRLGVVSLWALDGTRQPEICGNNGQ